MVENNQGHWTNTGVSNAQGMRAISNWLDQNERFKNSGTRAAIHGVYHGAIGVGKGSILNFEGASAEFRRAG